eukprot:UN09879
MTMFGGSQVGSHVYYVIRYYNDFDNLQKGDLFIIPSSIITLGLLWLLSIRYTHYQQQQIIIVNMVFLHI